jgi:autotransporter-associated beta strand protein
MRFLIAHGPRQISRASNNERKPRVGAVHSSAQTILDMILNRLKRLKRLAPLALPSAALFCATLPPSAHAGTHTWSGLGATGNFSDAQNWSSGGVPEGRESNVVLVFPAAASSKSPVQNIAGLGIDQMVIQGSGYHFGAAVGANYFLRGGVDKDIDNGSNNTTEFEPSATLVLNAETKIQGTGGSVLLEGAITGNGGMIVRGPEVEYAGATVNTYTGLTAVENGTLRLNKTIGVGFAGDLKIGLSFGSADNEKVILMRASQIPDASDVTITPTGWLNLNGYSDTLNNLTMTDGRVTTGAGALSLLGQIHVLTGNGSSTMAGRLNLGAASRSIEVETNGMLDVLGSIQGGAGAGINKYGLGALWLSESNSFSGPLHIYAGHVGIFDGWALGTTAGRTYVHAGAELVTYGASVISGEGLNLNGAGGPSGPGALKMSGFVSPLWKGDFIFESDASISVKTNLSFELNGPISGPGGLELVGGGELWLTGSSANTHLGTNRVRNGTLGLAKSAGLALPGPLIIGSGPDSNAPPCRVELGGSAQINPSAPISIYLNSTLDLVGNNQTVGPLTMLSGGRIDTGAGLLTLNDNVTVANAVPGADWSVIAGRLNLGSQSRTFQVAGPVDLDGDYDYDGALVIDANIQGNNVGFTKLGVGWILLEGTNTYSGLTVIGQGQAYLGEAASNPLGSSVAGTIVSNASTIFLYGNRTITNESLVLRDHSTLATFFWTANTNIWGGPIVLQDDSYIYTDNIADLIITGPISGPGGLRIEANSKVTFAGISANSYQGLTQLKTGLLRLNKPPGVNALPTNVIIGDGVGGVSSDVVLLLGDQQIADGASVEVLSSGGLDLNNFDEVIGGLQGSGRLFCQLGTLTLGGNNQDSLWSGGILGNAATTLIKSGSGTFRIDSDNYYSGRTIVQSGAVDVRGSLPSSVVRLQNTGTLRGTGTVNHIENLMGGTVSPGAAAGHGVLHSGNLAFSAGSHFQVDLQNTTPGTGHDQLDVTGTVNLGNASLALNPLAPTAVGTKFVLIKNDGADAVTGNFAGVAPGSSITVNGQRFEIAYNGGDGNDVVATHVNTPPSLTQITATPFASEGQSVHVQGTIADPDGSDDFTLVVNWGDGSPVQNISLPAGTQLFHVEHIYLDDKPGAQPSDSFTIEYTLTDSSGSPAFGQLNTVIGNVAPTVFAGGMVGIASGAAFVSTLTFTDPGSDVWSATVNYGDGSDPQSIAVGEASSLPLSHTFPSNGVYTVTVEVNDDDTGSGTGTFEVVVGLQLGIERRGLSNVDVTWPSSYAGFILESASSLPATNWTAVAGSPVLLNNQWRQTVPSTNAAAFFRLNKP